jgi:hypothetical protein
MTWQETGEKCIMRSLITCILSLPIIIRIIKSRRMRWVGHVAHMGEMRNTYKTLAEESERKRPHGRILGK